MKKLFLLFTIICAGQLYGMEPLYPEREVLVGTWEDLPTEVKSLIITAIAQSGNKLDEAIKNIVTFSRVSKELNNMINLNDLQGFTKIVRMIADKFDTRPVYIANEFNTPVAKRYWKLQNQLANSLILNNITYLKSVIAKGADIYSQGPEILHYYIRIMNVGYPRLEIIKLLLENGADPNAFHFGTEPNASLMLRADTSGTALDELNKLYQTAPEYEQIKKLLEKAMQKYPPSH